jgi:hypothetical protein
MSTRIYISSHDKAQAAEAAVKLRSEGYHVVSQWHDLKDNPSPDWGEAWARNSIGIQGADLFVLFTSPERVPGGKFVEAGYALGLDVPVLIVGDRYENKMLQGTGSSLFASLDELIAWLIETEDLDE